MKKNVCLDEETKIKIFSIIAGWAVGFLLFFVVYLLLMAVNVEGIMDIDSGACLEFNYTHYDNTTNITSNESENFCCLTSLENVTLTLALSPGETNQGSVDNCVYDVRCSTEQQGEQLCRVNKDLDHGETYELESGACDLRFECEEKVCDGVDGFEYSKDIKIYREDDIIYVDWDNETQKYYADTKQWSFTEEFNVECPDSEDWDELQETRDFLKVCENVIGKSDWLPRTLDKCFEQRDEVVTLNKDFTTELQGARDEVNKVKTLLFDCRSNENSTRILHDNDLNTALRQKDGLQQELDSQRSMKDLSISTNVMLLLFCVFLGFTLFQRRGKQ